MCGCSCSLYLVPLQRGIYNVAARCVTNFLFDWTSTTFNAIALGPCPPAGGGHALPPNRRISDDHTPPDLGAQPDACVCAAISQRGLGTTGLLPRVLGTRPLMSAITPAWIRRRRYGAKPGVGGWWSNARPTAYPGSARPPLHGATLKALRRSRQATLSA